MVGALKIALSAAGRSMAIAGAGLVMTFVDTKALLSPAGQLASMPLMLLASSTDPAVVPRKVHSKVVLPPPPMSALAGVGPETKVIAPVPLLAGRLGVTALAVA